jgi:hypothetical protein
LLDISRRNLDRVLYFAQYVVTYVDEDARQKALKRLEEKITVTEREQASRINAKIAETKAERDRNLAEFQQRKTSWKSAMTRLSREAGAHHPGRPAPGAQLAGKAGQDHPFCDSSPNRYGDCRGRRDDRNQHLPASRELLKSAWKNWKAS